jgi:hypothetical protein
MAGYKVIYEFKPFEDNGLDLPARNARRDALEEIASYVRDEILQYVGEGKSPVSGGEWKKTLSPEYKKIKNEISGVKFANMELYGDMLDALDYKVKTDGTISIGWFGGEQAAKADGHNNFSGKSTLPVRQSIPKPGEVFKRDIVAGMKEIAKTFLEDN